MSGDNHDEEPHEVVMTVFPATPEWERGYRWRCRDCDEYGKQIFDNELDARRDALTHQPKGASHA